MRVISDFFKGIDYFFKGLSFLFSKGLWYYMFYPVLVWVVMFTASIFLFGELIDGIVKWIEAELNGLLVGKMLFSLKLDVLVSIVTWISKWLLEVAFFFISSFFVKYTTLLLMPPILARLSEVVDTSVSGRKFKFSFAQFLKDIRRGLAITIRNLFLECLFILTGLILCFLFPPMIMVVPVVLFFISSYYNGFTMMDYSCERHRMSIQDGTAFIKKHKALVCGIGCCLWLLFLIPTVFGVLVALVIGPIPACIGATLAYNDLTKNERKQI